MATDALAAHEVWLAVLTERDGLVAAVHTGNIAPAAADALLAVEDGEDNGLAVQVVGRYKVGKSFTHKGGEFGNASARHVVL